MANSMGFSLILRAQTQQFRNEIAAAREELRRLNQELGGGAGRNGGAPFNHNPIAAGISSIQPPSGGCVLKLCLVVYGYWFGQISHLRVAVC